MNYSPTEDAIIIEEISKSPQNLRAAFELAATRLNKTPKAITGRYYTYIKKGSTVIGLVSQTTAVANVKNIPRAITEESIAFDTVMLALPSLNRQQKLLVISRLLENRRT